MTSSCFLCRSFEDCCERTVIYLWVRRSRGCPASLSVTRSCSCVHVEVGDVLASLSVTRSCMLDEFRRAWMLGSCRTVLQVLRCNLGKVLKFGLPPVAHFSSCCSLTLGNQHLFTLVGEGIAIFSLVGEVALRLSPWGRRCILLSD